MDDELVWIRGDNDNHWYTGPAEDPGGFGVALRDGEWVYYKVRQGWHPMPGELTLEEAKAMAVVMQRLGG